MDVSYSTTQRHPLDKQHIKLSYITHFYCNQNDPQSVFSLLREYEKLPLDIREVVEFVIVDDGSPIEYETGKYQLNITWLRIKEDIRWNQAGARNLGVTYAKSDKIIVLDLDQELPENTFRYLINHKNPGRNFYKIYHECREDGFVDRGKRYNIGDRYHGHSNTFFMSRARFMRFWGYDEEFAGNYGSEDFRFVKFHKYHGSKQRYLPKNIRCFERNVDRKKSYHSLNRDLTANTPVDLRKKQECSLFGAEYGHSRIFLNYTWEIKYQNNLIPQTLPPERKWWRPLWWFRYLFSPLAK
ncbi:glycosyltransferase [Pectobacterium aroidearum]|uniref:glycosyltransferase n=1 Tax=Pectobacterium aroidearum TaxID=1201031 RepID=UPI0021152AA4|nr:glycosyltransferase [Pectobacterium aroidearum]UUE36205.1 glycosyltransferase [Pectobacterium aroidearum]UUE40579.1 glycosyltransferase [Pectobacterium aroidearum]